MRRSVLILSILLIISCGRKTELNLQTIDLKYLNSLNESVIDTSLSKTFSDHYAFFLENSDSLLVKDVANLTCYNNNLVMLNKHKIILYDMITSRQIRTYNSSDYRFEAFDYDTLNNRLYTLDSKKSRIICFSITGVKEKEIALNPEFEYSNIFCLGNDNLLITAKSLPFPVTYVVNTKTDRGTYIDKPKKKSFTPTQEQYDSLVANAAPLYVYSKSPHGLLIKYLFNDTIYNYTAAGRQPAFFVKIGNDRVSFRNKRRLIKDNDRLCLLNFWRLNDTWLLRFRNKKYFSTVICDSHIRPFYPGLTMWTAPKTVFYIQGSNNLFMDERGQTLFSVQNYISKREIFSKTLCPI